MVGKAWQQEWLWLLWWKYEAASRSHCVHLGNRYRDASARSSLTLAASPYDPLTLEFCLTVKPSPHGLKIKLGSLKLLQPPCPSCLNWETLSLGGCFNKLGLLSPFPVDPVQTGRFFFTNANLIQQRCNHSNSDTSQYQFSYRQGFGRTKPIKYVYYYYKRRSIRLTYVTGSICMVESLRTHQLLSP